MLVGGAAGGWAVAETSTPAEAPPAAVTKRAPLRHGVFRFTRYPAAWTEAQKSQRPILVFVTSRSCSHCSRMIGETYQLAKVQEFVGGSFETVLVDRSEQPELVAKLRVRTLPTTIVVGADNKVMDVIEGYVDAAAFSRRLQTTLAAHDAETQTR